MLAVSSSLSLTPSKYLAGRLWLFYLFSTSVVPTRSLCKFLLVEPIFCGHWLCWSKFCWFDWSFRLGFHYLQILFWGIRWCHLPIFFSVFQSLCWSCILCSILVSIQQPFSAIFRSVMLRFWVPISISFFCESCSSIESLRFPSFPWHHSVLLFMYSIQSPSSTNVVSISSSASSLN